MVDTLRAPERRASPTTARTVARPLPRSDRLRRAAGWPHRVRGLRLGRSTDRVRAAVADRPFARLEGADPGLRAATPRRGVGQPRQRRLRSADGSGRPHDAPAGGEPRGGDGRRRACASGARGRLVLVGGDGRARVAAARPGQWPCVRLPGGADRRAEAGGRGAVRRAAAKRPGLEQGEHPLLAARLPRLPRVLLRSGLPGAPLDEADRRRGRLGAGHRPGDARRHAADAADGGRGRRSWRCARRSAPRRS